jgi:hypothetical protein
MDGRIYLIRDGKWEEMNQQQYDSEQELQEHLADYPNLLGGEQITPDNPRKWLLISREMGVPKEEGGSNTWSLDHLFLDQDGIPTLVELKRSSDTRSRREVVAQMLDYAANAVVYWSVEKVRAVFESNCQNKQIDCVTAVQEFIERTEETSIEAYWEKVKTNLQAQKIRLIFMADYIQPELRRIVEFLNGQMTPAEVLAVEVPRFVSTDQKAKALVPRVLGITPKSEGVKGTRPEKISWDEQSYFAVVAALNPSAVSLCQEILQWAREQRLLIRWGGGYKVPSMNLFLNHNNIDVQLVGLESHDRLKEDKVRIYLMLNSIQKLPPFTEKSMLKEILERVNQIPAVQINPEILDDSLSRYPGFPVGVLKNEQAMEQFLAALKWIVDEIRKN